MLTLQSKISLKELIKQSGMTQITLAKKLNLSRGYVSTIANTPWQSLSLDTITKVCGILGYEVNIVITKR